MVHTLQHTYTATIGQIFIGCRVSTFGKLATLSVTVYRSAGLTALTAESYKLLFQLQMNVSKVFIYWM